ncbi:hypothetical protein [Nostoc sp. CCY0012]
MRYLPGDVYDGYTYALFTKVTSTGKGGFHYSPSFNISVAIA